MAIQDVEDLRRHLPEFYENHDASIPVDDLVVIPTRAPEAIEDEVGRPYANVENAIDPSEDLEEFLADWDFDNQTAPPELLGEVDPRLMESLSGCPGGLLNQPSGEFTSTIIERLAFYMPFHRYRNWWGIYIFPEGLLRARWELAPFFREQKVPPRDQVQTIKRLLYHHEFYHHATESYATRMEAMLNVKSYLAGFSRFYGRTRLTAGCLEETCANSYARERTIYAKKGFPIPTKPLRDAIDGWFRGMPPGYAEASKTGADWQKHLKPRFLEACAKECLSDAGRKPLPDNAVETVWTTARHFDRAIGDMRNRLTYLIPKDSPLYKRLPLNVISCIKTGELKRRLKALRIGDFYKQGGSHELWLAKKGGRPVPIPRHEGRDIPKGTMAKILKEFGTNMSIDDFLAARV